MTLACVTGCASTKHSAPAKAETAGPTTDNKNQAESSSATSSMSMTPKAIANSSKSSTSTNAASSTDSKATTNNSNISSKQKPVTSKSITQKQTTVVNPQTKAASSVSKPNATPDKPSPSASLDLAALEQRLRDTRAIGVFTKLSLKNQVDDLLDQFRAVHSGKSNIPLTTLRQQYDLLLMKLLTLLQDNDSTLAASISSSREAIWDILKDPKKFAQI